MGVALVLVLRLHLLTALLAGLLVFELVHMIAPDAAAALLRTPAAAWSRSRCSRR